MSNIQALRRAEYELFRYAAPIKIGIMLLVPDVTAKKHDHCQEVYPVDIPIPDLLLRLRDKGKQEAPKKAAAGTPQFGIWAVMSTNPMAWKATLRLGYALNYPPGQAFPIPALQAWRCVRKFPPWRGGKFRQWINERKTSEIRTD